MTQPAQELARIVLGAVRAVFGPEHATVDPAVHRSQFADYQADVALRLARAVKRPPLEVANALAERIDVSEMCDSVRVSPPGFINFTLSKAYLDKVLNQLVRDERAGVTRAHPEETIVVDYSSPNVAKEMHVGHLRPTGIGDSIVRLLAFKGHRVIRQNHIGDWGTPFGMLIEHLIDLKQDGNAEETQLSQLNEFYKAARLKFDGDPSFAERARRRVVALQAGDRETLELWSTLVGASRRYFTTIYEAFGALLRDGDVRGESFYNEFLGEVVAELEAKGIARVDQGALCVFLPQFTGREGEPLPLIVRKSDGGYGYATTDLAALRYRARTLKAKRVLYVVGAPQAQHFAMVFETARLAGWLEQTTPEHVPFGSVLGTDRKILRTRAGDTPKLADLLEEATSRADAELQTRSADLTPEARREVARRVGTAALKYADLSTERIKDYVFDWSRMISFEGNTGPYLLYAYARVCSVFRKAAAAGNELASELERGGVPESAAITLEEPAERALALDLLGFGDAVDASSSGLQPHRLCSYLYELATKFSTFWENAPILQAPTPELQSSRLLLAAATRRTLGIGLELLGIQPVERM